MDSKQLEAKVHEFRKQIMNIGYKTQSGHLSSALSCMDIMTALYYGDILKYNALDIKNENRDRFILSKGHACIIQYVILADLGLINEDELYRFCRPGAQLGAHPDCLKIKGIEASTGALGHGLSYAIGVAMGAKYLRKSYQVYTILGDGECQEGSVWEAALYAGFHKLDNLTVIVDYNKLQASDYTNNITSLDPLINKWISFGFDSYEIDGHNMEQIMEVLSLPLCGKPKAIVANTLKGKGVSLMENQNHWHGRKPNDEEWKMICSELGI